MNHRLLAAAAALLLLAAAPVGAEMRSFQTFQGYTGIMNVPNALTAPEGAIDLLNTNQIEPQWRDAAQRRVVRQDNYLFTLGAFSHLEGAMRLAEAPGRARDLSANAKLRIPWIPAYYPQLAIGIQDVAGGAPHLRTIYAVASHQWEPFRFSAGYGRGPDRLKGVFGGVELRLADWLYLLAEHDTYEAAAGLRLATSADRRVSLGLTLRTPLERAGNFDVAVGLRIPLGRRPAPPAPAGGTASSMEGVTWQEGPTGQARQARQVGQVGQVGQAGQAGPAGAAASSAPVLASKTRPDHPISTPAQAQAQTPAQTQAQAQAQAPAPTAAALPDQAGQLRALRRELADLGFEDVRVGTIGPEVCYLELENSRFNRNEVDGIGVALGVATRRLPATFTRVVLRVKKLNLPVIEISAPVAPLRTYLNDPSPEASDQQLPLLANRLQVANAGRRLPAGLTLLPGVENRQRGHSALVLRPGLRTTVGTEVGVFDYRLSARADLITRLWPGATLNSRADIPVDWSDNFREGATFNRTGHNDPVIDRVFLSQAHKLSPAVTNQIGAGLLLEDTYGVLNETIWLPEPGTHRLRLQLGRYRDQDDRKAGNQILGSYRYALPAWDLALEGTAGRFFGGDEGVQLEAQRFFGDVAVAAIYTHTEERMLSFRITVPLTTRRDMKPGLLQVRGAEQFGHQLNTVLARKGDANPVVFGLGTRAQTMVNIERAIHNADRLHHRYLRQQLPRMRDAHLRYGGPAPAAAAAISP